MEEVKISVTYSVLKSHELTDQQREVIKHAKGALSTAYSPYSNYQVAAAILMENGEVVIGNNQENAVYPLGLCAERVALFNMGANFPTTKPVFMFLTVASERKPGFPCGSCRQALIEFEQRYACDISLLIESRNDEYLLFKSAKELLPFAFDSDNLS